MIEGLIFVKLGTIDEANPVIDAVHTQLVGCKANDWTEATVETDSGTMFLTSPSDQ
jgi:hypothetical protein